MDYTQRRIGSGEIVYAFGVLDIFNSDIVILDAHKTKSGANVVESLHQLRKMTLFQNLVIFAFLDFSRIPR